MKVSIGIGGAASGHGRDIQEQVAYVLEAEKLGGARAPRSSSAALIPSASKVIP